MKIKLLFFIGIFTTTLAQNSTETSTISLLATSQELDTVTEVTTVQVKEDEHKQTETNPLLETIRISSSVYKLQKSPNIYDTAKNEAFDVKYQKFLQEHPNEIEVKSENYPLPYPKKLHLVQDFRVEEGIGVQITVHFLDLDPNKDFIQIQSGKSDDDNKKGPVLTGSIKDPIRFLIPQKTTFTLTFVSQHENNENLENTGFLLTYSPFGKSISITTPTTTEVTVAPEELQWTRKEIVIPRSLQNNSTEWDTVKEALSNATNLFIEAYNFTYFDSDAKDIKLKPKRCPETWPQSEDCVNLEFAVPLIPIPPEISDDEFRSGLIKLTTTEAPEPKYELSSENLDIMWEEFGIMELGRNGIDMYLMPENSSVLFIWIAISLCIVGAFIFVLYSIWKLDFFRDYKRMSEASKQSNEDQDILKKKEIDISMFPSPHQIVPSLFPISEQPEPPYESYMQNNYPGHDNRAFEPLSPLDYATDIVDFNDGPKNRNKNPFLPNNSDLNYQTGSR